MGKWQEISVTHLWKWQFKRLDYSVKSIHNDSLPNDSSRIRDCAAIPDVGEQGSQYSKKVAESRS